MLEMMLTRSGRVTAIVLVVIWIFTIALVIDTRKNFTKRTVKHVDCPCRLQPSANSVLSAARGNASTNGSEPRTVVKWLRYCRHEKGDFQPDEPPDEEVKQPPPPQVKKPDVKPVQGKPQAPGKPKLPPPRKFINPHPFYFTMKNSDACSKDTNANGYVDALCLVLTSPTDSFVRSLIRKTWGGAKFVKGKRIVTMFLLGKRDDETQHLLELENNHYHDIIQENFYDSYYNLTLKTLMGMKWASQFCRNARYILKVDMDMFVNVYNLVDRLDTAPTFTFAEGQLKGVTEPIRHKQSKWYTSIEVYPNKTYPPYLNGPAYLLSADLSAQIFGTSLRQRLVPWEDAYVGIIMHRIHVEPKNNRRYSLALDYSDLQDTLRKISESIAFHLGEDKDENRENFHMVWNYVQQLNDVSVPD